MECGYCEPVCPSRSLTLTPRQRIVVRRASTAARERGDGALVAELEKDYDYDGVQTCAVDGMCQTACPVLINTGTLMKRFRREDATPVLAAGWSAAATGWGAVTRAGSAALSVASAVPLPVVRTVTDAARAVLGTDTCRGTRRSCRRVGRLVARSARGSARRRRAGGGVPARVRGQHVRARRRNRRDRGVRATARARRGGGGGARRHRRAVLRHPWSSKGYAKGHATMTGRVRAAVREASVTVRFRSCATRRAAPRGSRRRCAEEGVEVVDAVAFAASTCFRP